MKFNHSVLLTLLFGNAVLAARINNYYKPVGHVRTDTIVSPNCLSDHVHTFYGPPALRPDATTADLLAQDPYDDTGNTLENMSLYWHPTIYHYDPDTNVHTREDIMYLAAYYYWERRSDLVAFPKDFKMIARRDDKVPGEFKGVAECIDDEGDIKNPDRKDCEAGGDCYTESTFFPRASCRYFEFTMSFPICWDGRLDSDDHMSHVAYTVDGKLDGNCPTSHSYGRFPLISLFVSIENYKGGWYKFSDESDIMHADYLAGWDEAFLQNILNDCNTNRLDNCDHYMTFKGNTELADLYPRPVELEKVQPSEPYDTLAISPERTDVIVGDLPRGQCTGTLLDENGNVINQDGGPPVEEPPVEEPPVEEPPVEEPPVEEPPVEEPPVEEPPSTSRCTNDPTFRYNDNENKDCDWVADSPLERCSKRWDYEFEYVREYCPGSCDPVCTCQDDPTFKYRNDPDKDCNWVARKPSKRCNKTWDYEYEFVYEYCPVACDRCE